MGDEHVYSLGRPWKALDHFSHPSPMLRLALLAIASANALLAWAQTAQEVNDCYGSIVQTNYEVYPTYSTADTTAYTPIWTYNATACTNPQIGVNRVSLTDVDGGLIYACTKPSFSSSGDMTSTCERTYSQMSTLR